ncbi:MAG TPA: VCBS repeat-containing protein, partial [bacterium]|nr:VCBS repeat-containing protein [bacterium]
NFKPGELVTVLATTNAKNSGGTSISSPSIYTYTAAASSAPATFADTTNFFTGNLPFGAVAADFDGDGDLDIATANIGDNGVAISFNNGSGHFTGPTLVTTGNGARSVVAADFDGDGDVDIASANQYDNSLSVRFNNGSGSFSGSATLQVTSGPVYIKAVDVDGDGDLDLASANIGDLANYTPDNDSVSIRINDGSGNFSGSTNIGIDDRVTSVEPADIDNDGDMDLLATGFGSLRVFPLINNGSGSFTLGTPVYAGDGPMVAVADFDGDGDVDFATANGSTNTQ